jgi:hypothetical protein
MTGGRLLRNLSALILLTSALASAAPAGARIVGRAPSEPIQAPSPFIGDSRVPGPGIGRDIHDTRDRIEDARESGAITRREARYLRREARLIGHLARRYGHDGLSQAEQTELEARTRYLRGRIGRSAAP